MWTLTNTHHFLTMCTLDAPSVNANRMTQSLNSTRRCLNHVFSAGATEKSPGWEKPHAETSAWSYGMEGHAQKNACNDTVNWQTRKWSNFTKFRILVWMIINSNRNWNQLESCHISLLANCLEMFILSTNWMTWHLMVSEQACKITDKMDSGLISFFSSHKWLSSILSCDEWWTRHHTADWVYSKTQTLQEVLRTRNLHRWCHVHFLKSYVCPNQLDVQEANFSFTQFYRVWNHFFGCWIAHGWVTWTFNKQHKQHCKTK